MGERLLEVMVPAGQGWDVFQALDDAPVIGMWRVEAGHGRTITRVLVSEGDTEAVLDRLQDRFEEVEGYRVILLNVEATLPRVGEPDDEHGEAPGQAPVENHGHTSRISVAELYDDVLELTKLDRNFVVMVVVASIVAAIGLILNNVAIIIGAMVIAPLLGPSVGLSLASTLGDARLAWTAFKASLVGITAAAVVPFVIGIAYPVDPELTQIQVRSVASLWDVGLGLAVGVAGVLAVTTGAPAALVGVMVAVALIPPLVAAALLAGAGHLDAAFGAALLLTTYVIAINLAGVVTFAFQGVRPRDYYEAGRAKRATWTAGIVWAALLAALAVIIVYTQDLSGLP